MKRRDFLKLAGTTSAAALLAGFSRRLFAADENRKPLNILLLTADDMNWNSLGVSGCPVPQTTPNIDKFAGDGMRFQNAHVNIAVCQPSRTCMLTGLYPHRSGGEGFEFAKPGTPNLPETFKHAGYMTGCFGKLSHMRAVEGNHYDFEEDYGQLSFGRDPQVYKKYVDEFFAKCKSQKKPFFLAVNSHDPHRPWSGSMQEKRNKAMKERPGLIKPPSRIYKADEINIPGFLPKLPDIATEMAQYYSSVRRCDDTMGAVLDSLKQNGFYDNTVVIFLSDNGISMPFAKTNCYLNSTKTPLIVRWPNVVKPATINKTDMVSEIDITATILDMAGLKQYADMDGKSFKNLLVGGEKHSGQDIVFTQFHETSGKRRFPIRAVQDTKYGYLFNLWSDGKREFKNEAQTGLTWKAMVEAAKNNPDIAKRVEFYSYRTVEEFYDLQNDPDCLVNLINDKKYKDEIDKKRAQLLDFMKKTNDPALEPYLDRSKIGAFMAAQEEKAAGHNKKRNKRGQAGQDSQEE